MTDRCTRERSRDTLTRDQAPVMRICFLDISIFNPSISVRQMSTCHSLYPIDVYTMRKQLDPRIPALITNGVKANHRSFFVMVGDKGLDQVSDPSTAHDHLLILRS